MRETLFNWLQPILSGARVLDLFAGSGALGLEAVSRGADQAYLIERNPALVESLRNSVRRLDQHNRIEVITADTLHWLDLPTHGRFDLIFLDPPFAEQLWTTVLAKLPAWCSDHAWLYLESPVDAVIAPGPAWQLHRQIRSQQTNHVLYRRSMP